ncbi:MAG: D-alanine--D-alanine ligase [Oceanospirillaceae bacterium]|nr:D-alanine--D-alanine ligase [Oceanospirillaceae bacterium]MBT4443263.1 D-alanine--D-alanine ligase [Oceanospirillaceae bacterium]MBT6078354.1 D-alanine--D-alanine ligase [Oceanospirillaceae bacterium]
MNLATRWADLLLIPKARVAVIYGGTSAEREISLMSGQQVLENLLATGVNAFGLDLGADGQDPVAQLQQADMDVAFIIVHGRGGEDGTLQGVLEFMQVPYTGCDVLSSSLGMNKLMTKLVWLAQGVKTPPYEVLNDSSNWAEVAKRLGLPLVVKPVHEGSSLGINIVDSAAALERAYREAARYDREVMAEYFIDGDEYSVPIVNDIALPAIRLETDNGFYDLQAKYYSDETRYMFGNAMTDAEQRAMHDECRYAFQVLGCRDWGRIDVMRDKDGNNWLLEVNTSPGMTGHSLVPMAAEAAGLDFGQLTVVLLNLALAR